MRSPTAMMEENMYKDYFGMTGEPFARNVPVSEMYESAELKEMAERLRAGIAGNEFMILVSEPGCGKTTLLRRLYKENEDVLFIYINGLNTNTRKLYCDILRQMGIDIGYYRVDARELAKSQLTHLHREGKKVCIVIDEAHVLRINLLHEAQYLLNESYDSESYLSMVLCGQPKLWKKMTDVNEYHAIEDRFQIGCTLHPLNLKDTQEYIRHCLQCCGCTKNLFTEDAYQAIHHNTGGRMRRINRICTTALMYAAQNNMNTIDENTIHYIEQHEMLCMNRNETEDRTPLSE